jgi:hypothetical protein
MNVRYVRLFFGGTTASSAISWSRPIAKMLYDPGVNLLGLSSPGAIPCEDRLVFKKPGEKTQGLKP